MYIACTCVATCILRSLDRCVYLGVSDTHELQLKVLQALTRKFRMSRDVDLLKVYCFPCAMDRFVSEFRRMMIQLVESCPFTYTGADFYALASDALLHSMKRQIALVDQHVAQRSASQAGGADLNGVRTFLATLPADHALLQVEVTMQDLEQARAALTPSISEEELRHYTHLQAQFASKGR